MFNIHVPANKAWDFFTSNKERCEEEIIEIANNEDTGYAVHITECNGCPYFIVTRNDKPEYEEKTVSEKACNDALSEIYRKYLLPLYINSADYSEEDDMTSTLEDMIRKAEIDEREETLASCLMNLISEFANDDETDYSALLTFNEVDILLNDICCLLSDAGISVYRPMYLTTTTGKEVYCEHPYDEYDLSEGGDRYD